ncbi:MAG: 16S rRNA (cytosine(1402)-N(4))-methyltransferase RsmH [Bacteroidales bacterium]|jgi:16S rRNA (cytosine1402-N4)-methyltransferase|nr:16S rRNA (cytosine(1402)-N(4))-methyltransferase RsmH [Bacteroidales bacterium]MDD3843335.1 16S rRNA (cytosine(1402)-N(4))-methyltransferase RsmH [Bacteroidales bacterium]MDD4617608.1 16S rRNA (cytosine(1402)-N(4))-methyltransferase RsmH [Bacteroidales bacterium]
MENYHIPVLLEESVSAMALQNGGIYADVTFGGGGHSKAILERMGAKSKLIAMDRDSDALANAPDDKRLTLVHNNYRFLSNYIEYNGYNKIDGVLADLGVSSHQFDTEQRGFSFRFDSPLDMRMNQKAKTTAAQILNSYQQDHLAKILYLYGEVENSRKVAALVCAERDKGEITTTFDLNRILAPVLPKFAEHKYLAKVYQALRIEVNGEMRALELFLESVPSILKPGGRLVVITYHSLEDRMVKNCMKTGNVTGHIEKDLYGNFDTPFKVITKKPILPQEGEIAQNTRARSAKLRVAEKI